MKLSWYDLYKKSNALPFELDEETLSPLDKRWIMNPSHGKVKIDNVMTQETADRERKDNPKFNGCGSFGCAVNINGNYIRKYTESEQEAFLAKSLIGNVKYPVVKVFEVRQLQDNLWAIDMEKLIPLKTILKNMPDMESAAIYGIFEALDLSLSKEEIILLAQKSYFWNLSRTESIELRDLIDKYSDKILRLKTLAEINLFWDCKIKNIGQNSKGDWVIFDLEPDLYKIT